MPPTRRKRRRAPLPEILREQFWDYDFKTLDWDSDRDLIIARTLAVGTWDAVRWLRRQLDAATLRDWLIAHDGAGLDPKQLRFWELIVDVPHRLVEAWLSDPNRQVWDQRARR